MASSRFKLNHSGMKEILNSDGVRADMMRRAEAAAAAARGYAPVETGAYRNGIHAETATTDRAVGRVVASADHSLVVEARLRVLGRALDAAGD